MFSLRATGNSANFLEHRHHEELYLSNFYHRCMLGGSNSVSRWCLYKLGHYPSAFVAGACLNGLPAPNRV